MVESSNCVVEFENGSVGERLENVLDVGQKVLALWQTLVT
jgi:hypothetical protein